MDCVQESEERFHRYLKLRVVLISSYLQHSQIHILLHCAETGIDCSYLCFCRGNWWIFWRQSGKSKSTHSVTVQLYIAILYDVQLSEQVFTFYSSQTSDAVIYAAVCSTPRGLPARPATVKYSGNSVVYSKIKYCQQNGDVSSSTNQREWRWMEQCYINKFLIHSKSSLSLPNMNKSGTEALKHFFMTVIKAALSKFTSLQLKWYILIRKT